MCGAAAPLGPRSKIVCDVWYDTPIGVWYQTSQTIFRKTEVQAVSRYQCSVSGHARFRRHDRRLSGTSALHSR